MKASQFSKYSNIFGTTGNIDYIYNAVGQKLQKSVFMASQGSIPSQTYYLNGFQYVFRENFVDYDTVLKFFPTSEGYVKNTAGVYAYVYNYTDHLGNIRLSYQDTDKNGTISSNEILEESNYYPFGLKHSGYNGNNAQANYKYKYNGKELQDELGLNMEAMDWRQYDPAIGRFVVIDPMAEFQRKWSPYHFGFDNPVLYNDPTGLEGEEVAKKKKGEPGDPDNPIPLKEVVVKGHKKSTTSSVTSFLWASVDYVPFAGSIKQIGVGIHDGDWKQVALGAVFLTVDFATAGEGGEALRLAEVATEDALKIAAEDEAKELVEQNLDNLVEEAIELHHSDPKFLGGEAKQELTPMTKSEHSQLHKDLNAHLKEIKNKTGQHMRPQRGNSGKIIQKNFTRQERVNALKDFYNGTGSKYTNAAASFFKQHP